MKGQEANAQRHSPSPPIKPLIMAGVVLGIGLGGFFDGILFHQILQTHSMLSGRLPRTTVSNLEINMFWDGLFHAVTWLTTVIGLRLFWGAGRPPQAPWSGRIFVSSLFIGWGLFNLVEGVIDHHILHLHHVVENKGVSWYDDAFLGSGLLFILVGGSVVRHARRQPRV